MGCIMKKCFVLLVLTLGFLFSMNPVYGRLFSSKQTRFVSPDPVTIDGKRLLDPQLLNLYSYCRNNPLLYTDPTGMDSYVFYDPNNFEDQAWREAEELLATYDTNVFMYSVTSEEQFVRDWNSMNGGVSGSIDGVSLLFHGTEGTIDISSGEYMTASESGMTPLGNQGTPIGSLESKQMLTLNVLTCQGGNIDPGPNGNVVQNFVENNKILLGATGWDGKISYDSNQRPRTSYWQGSFISEKGRAPLGQVLYWNSAKPIVTGVGTTLFNYGLQKAFPQIQLYLPH